MFTLKHIKILLVCFIITFFFTNNSWSKTPISKGPLSKNAKRFPGISDNVKVTGQQSTFSLNSSSKSQLHFGALASQALEPGYKYDVIANTHTTSFQGKIPSSLGLPSINDSGKVAFTAQLSTDNRPSIVLFDYDSNTIVRNYFRGSPFRVSNFIQVNNNDHIAFQSKTDDNLISNVNRLDGAASGDTIASGSLTQAAFGDFDIVFPYPTINNNDLVAFTAQDAGSTFVGSGDDGLSNFNLGPRISGTVTMFPMISDLGETIEQYGASSTSPLLYSSEDFSTRLIMASTSGTGGVNSRFYSIGNKPGISQDGNIIVFMADHPTLGRGVFIYVWDALSNVYRGPSNIVPIPPASLLSYRVGVNEIGSNQYLISLFALDENALLGLYSIKVDMTNPQQLVGYDFHLLAQVGQGLPNHSFTIQDMNSYDPVNTKGQIAFLAQTNQGPVIIRVSDLNKVTWANGEPIAGAVIEAYYFAKDPQNPGNPPIITPISGTTVSQADGTFLLPKNIRNTALFPNEIDPPKRGVRAKLTYNRAIRGNFNTPTTISETIINYPEWDPNLPLKKPTIDPITITFPNPVFFVPGMNGLTNSGDEDSDGKIRAFFTLDSGATPSEITALANQYAGTSKVWRETEWKQNLMRWVGYKNTTVSGTRIPGFVYFTIPTHITGNVFLCFNGPNDQVDWGINACMGQTDVWIKESALHISNYLDRHVKTEIARFSPQGVDNVPLDVLAHSLGGIITRNWLASKIESTYPSISHYITFDSPHGGVKVANSSLLRALNSFWSEAKMNGISDQLNVEPLNARNLGWNYGNIIKFSDKNLLFSAENERLGLGLVPFIAPDGTTGTALGMGRIVRPLSLFSLFDVFGSKPNGFCKRFIGGWGLQIYGQGSDQDTLATHSIQNQPIAFVPASRFITNSNPPSLGTFSEPGSAVVPALQLAGDGVCQDVDAGLSVPALATVYVNATANTQADTTVYFDHSGTVSVTAFLNNPAARIIVLNNTGGEIPRSQEQETLTEGDGKIISFKIFAGSGQGKVRLIASDASVHGKVLLGYDNDIYATINAENINSSQNSPILIKTALLKSNGTIFKGTLPNVTVKVQDASGVDTIVPVYDDGLHNDVANNDGIFGGSFTPTTGAGHYSLFVDFKVTNSSGYTVHRSGDGMVTVDSQVGAKKQFKEITYLDTDGNGKPDTIDVAFDSYVYENGSLSLSADLKANGQVIDSFRDNFEVTTVAAAAVAKGLAADANPVIHTSHFRISSRILYKAGAFPLTLTSITLSDNSKSLYLDSFPDYQIPAINLTQFDPPEAPHIISVQPGFGKHSGGDLITIHGKNMESVTAVYFGSLEATIVRTSSENITVTLPEWDGVHFWVDIRVVTPWNETTKLGAFEYFTPNLPPQLASIGNKSITEGTLLQFTVAATDPEGKPLTLTAILGNGNPLSSIGATFIDNSNGTGTFQWTPAIGQTGNTVVFTVTDTDGATSTAVVLLSVTKVGIGQAAANLLTQLRGNTDYANHFYIMYGLAIPTVNMPVSPELTSLINSIVAAPGYNQTKYLRDLSLTSGLLSSLRSSLLWSTQFKTIYGLSIPLDGTLNLIYQDGNTLYEFLQPKKLKKKSFLNTHNNALYSLTFDVNGNPQDLTSGAAGAVSLNIPSTVLGSLSIGAGVNVTLTDALSESEMRFFSSNIAPLIPLRTKLLEIVGKSSYSLSVFINSLAYEADASLLLHQLQSNPDLANHFQVMYGLSIPQANAIISDELHNVLIGLVGNYSYDQGEYLRVLPLASNLLSALRTNLTWANQFKTNYGPTFSIPLDGGLGLTYQDGTMLYEFIQVKKLMKKSVLNASNIALYSLTFDINGNPQDLTSGAGGPVSIKMTGGVFGSITIGAGVSMTLTDTLTEAESRFFSANIAPLSQLRAKLFEITGDSDYNQSDFLNSLNPAPAPPAATITTPENLVAQEISNQRVNLNWSTSQHSKGQPIRYKVFRSLNGINFSVIGVTTTTTFADSSLRQKKTRYYKIKAFDTRRQSSDFSQVKKVQLKK